MRNHPATFATLLLGLGVLLSGCETTTNPITELAAYRARAQDAGAQQTAEKKPVSRAQAAMDCWSIVEKSHATASVDARGDFVHACIEAKMNGKPPVARAAKPKPEPKPDAKPKN